MQWREIAGNWTLIPSNPKGIVHFLGGAFIGSTPHLTYRLLLERLYRHGYAVITTPFIIDINHAAIARSVVHAFEQTLDRLYHTGMLRKRSLPVYGVGHSMGCKLHLLSGSLFDLKRAGNVLISYNNFPVRQSIPFVEQFSALVPLDRFAPNVPMEFSPTPEETNEIVARDYLIRRNLLVKFKDDTIDQTTDLHEVLQRRFPGMVTLKRVNGNHLTPLGQDLDWQAGASFSPLDAIGQWVKQEFQRDLTQLYREICLWLDPTRAIS
jgi:hypothetical protein